MRAIEAIEAGQVKPRPQMKSGDTVRVHVKVREGDKERIQVFEGIVIGMHRGGARATFTVRKVSFGQGVERIFPLHSPIIDKIDIVRSARVRRAKLYFLRELKGKAARMKETQARRRSRPAAATCRPAAGSRLDCAASREPQAEAGRSRPCLVRVPPARSRTPSGGSGSSGSPAWTRWVGAAWPAPSWPAPSSSTPTGTFPASGTPSCSARRSATSSTN